MQEVSQDEFQGQDLFAGAIHGVLCSSKVTFLEPATIRLAVSLGGSVVSIPRPYVCLLRILFFFLCSRERNHGMD